MRNTLILSALILTSLALAQTTTPAPLVAYPDLGLSLAPPSALPADVSVQGFRDWFGPAIQIRVQDWTRTAYKVRYRFAGGYTHWTGAAGINLWAELTGYRLVPGMCIELLSPNAAPLTIACHR